MRSRRCSVGQQDPGGCVGSGASEGQEIHPGSQLFGLPVEAAIAFISLECESLYFASGGVSGNELDKAGNTGSKMQVRATGERVGIRPQSRGLVLRNELFFFGQPGQ